MLQKLVLVLLSSMVWISPDENLIDWNSSNKLDWSDFKARPDGSSSNAALTSSTINVEFAYDKNGLKHTITCRFNKLKSWVRVKNNYILNHEQGHFDLAEIYARELHRKLKEYQFRKETASEDLNKLYNRVMKEHLESQDLYDRQSNHSIDSTKQRYWDNKIKANLKELEEYADYR